MLAAPPVTMTLLVPPTPLPLIVPPAGTVAGAPPAMIGVVGTAGGPKIPVPVGVLPMTEVGGGIVTAPPGMVPGVGTPPVAAPGASCPPGTVPGESWPPTDPGAIVPPSGGTMLALAVGVVVVTCGTIVVGVVTFGAVTVGAVTVGGVTFGAVGAGGAALAVETIHPSTPTTTNNGNFNLVFMNQLTPDSVSARGAPVLDALIGDLPRPGTPLTGGRGRIILQCQGKH